MRERERGERERRERESEREERERERKERERGEREADSPWWMNPNRSTAIQLKKPCTSPREHNSHHLFLSTITTTITLSSSSVGRIRQSSLCERCFGQDE